jgi:ElaB/YqjD/DUF883 family membrane-anchored ribosome-binding protein
MLESTRTYASKSALNGAARDVDTDMRTLVKDAQTLLTAAASLTGDKAEELRAKGMALLDNALGKAHNLQGQAIVKGRQIAEAGDTYVKENPWKTVAAAAGLALIVGLLLGRKSSE